LLLDVSHRFQIPRVAKYDFTLLSKMTSRATRLLISLLEKPARVSRSDRWRPRLNSPFGVSPARFLQVPTIEAPLRPNAVDKHRRTCVVPQVLEIRSTKVNVLGYRDRRADESPSPPSINPHPCVTASPYRWKSGLLVASRRMGNDQPHGSRRAKTAPHHEVILPSTSIT